MKNKLTKRMLEIINISEKMGLRFNEEDNFPDMLLKEKVAFKGAGSQRVLIDTKLDLNDIYSILGDAMIEFGKRSRSIEIHNLLNPY